MHWSSTFAAISQRSFMEAIGTGFFKTSMFQIACGLHSYYNKNKNNILEVFVGHLRSHRKWDIEQEQLEFLPCSGSVIDVGLSTTRTMNKFGLSVTVLYCRSIILTLTLWFELPRYLFRYRIRQTLTSAEPAQL